MFGIIILCMYIVSYSYTDNDMQYTSNFYIFLFVCFISLFLNQSTRLWEFLLKALYYLKYSPITFVWVIKMYMIFLDIFRNSY